MPGDYTGGLYTAAHGLVADVAKAAKVALDGASVRTTTLRKALQGVRPLFDLASADQRADQRRALPGVLPVDLGDRGTEALPLQRLQRLQLLALALQVLRLAEVQPQLDDADKRAHPTKVLAP